MGRKFKERDKVLLLKDLSETRYVEKSYWGHFDEGMWYSMPVEKVVLDDGKVYLASDLTFYSEPIKILASKIKRIEES